MTILQNTSLVPTPASTREVTPRCLRDSSQTFAGFLWHSSSVGSERRGRLRPGAGKRASALRRRPPVFRPTLPEGGEPCGSPLGEPPETLQSTFARVPLDTLSVRVVHLRNELALREQPFHQ